MAHSLKVVIRDEDKLLGSFAIMDLPTRYNLPELMGAIIRHTGEKRA